MDFTSLGFDQHTKGLGNMLSKIQTYILELKRSVLLIETEDFLLNKMRKLIQITPLETLVTFAMLTCFMYMHL